MRMLSWCAEELLYGTVLRMSSSLGLLILPEAAGTGPYTYHMRRSLVFASVAVFLFAASISPKAALAAVPMSDADIALAYGNVLAAHPSYFHTFNKDLRPGDRGREVRNLQGFLNQQGFLISAQESPYFGTSTKMAVQKLQQALQLPATGVFDAALRNAINVHLVRGTIIASSTNQTFSFPHGITTANGAMVIGTVHRYRDMPGEIIEFPDPANLHTSIATTTPGFEDLADAVYDSQHNKIYFVSSRINNRHLVILSVDPTTLAWQPVYEFPNIYSVGYSTVATDGTYLYAATQSMPPAMLKIRIADWSLVTRIVYPQALGGFHSSELHIYPDREEWYVNTYSSPTQVYKVNVADMTSTSTTVSTSHNVTNDVYFHPIDNNGGILYLPSEGEPGLDAFNTQTMTSTHYIAPISYGVFSAGHNLYSLDYVDHAITKYPYFDLSKPILIRFSRRYPVNEWFPGPNFTTGFFTVFATSSALYEYSFKE